MSFTICTFNGQDDANPEAQVRTTIVQNLATPLEEVCPLWIIEDISCRQARCPLWAESGHGQLRAFRKYCGHARQNHPDLGEPAWLRIDLD